MFKFFKSEFYQYEFLRVLGVAPFQGSEITEVLEARLTLKENDPESWYGTWYEQGERAIAIGEDAVASGDRIAARWAFLRAANYFRASEFFLHLQPSDPRLYDSIKRSSSAHDRAMSFMDTDVVKLQIPYDDKVELPARLYLPAPENRLPGPIPLLLHTSGFDGTGEELYFYGAAEAVPRGYAVLTFDGPGQGISLRRDRTTLRPDWEHVTGKVLDYIFDTLAPENEYLELDLDRIGIMGAVMGGYFALRSASDPRIKAAIAVNGFYNLFEIIQSKMPGFFINGWMNGKISDGIFNSVTQLLCRFNFQLAWEISQSYWCYGVNSPADVVRVMQTMSLSGPNGERHLANVSCPVLIMNGEEEVHFGNTPISAAMMSDLNHLDDTQKKLWMGDKPTKPVGKYWNLNVSYQQMFDFLDRQFGIKRPALSRST